MLEKQKSLKSIIVHFKTFLDVLIRRLPRSLVITNFKLILWHIYLYDNMLNLISRQFKLKSEGIMITLKFNFAKCLYR
jgi:hypothetical protein